MHFGKTSWALWALALGTLNLEARPAFFLPSRIYAAPGLECNVYYKNIFDSVVPQNYAFQAFSPKGKAQLKRWTFTPEEADRGKTYPLVVNAWSDAGIVAAVTSEVVVAARPLDPKRRTTLALFGDSLTNCGFQDQILADMKAAGFTGYTPVGRRVREGRIALHDGYGGYTCTAFLTRYQVAEDEAAHLQDAAEREQLRALGLTTKVVHEWQRALLKSPLIRLENGQKKVDVQHWLDQVNGGRPPDIVLVELGVNDIFRYEGEEPELRARMRAELLPTFDRFFAVLKEKMPRATYLLVTQPVGCSQDGFAANYGASWNEVQFRKIAFALNREFADYVAAKKDIDLRLVPWGQAIDPECGYILRRESVHAQDPKTLVWRDSNAVHPGDAGGRQLGDALAAYLQCLLGQTGSRGASGK